MTWKPNIVTRQAIQGFISDLFATAPEIMGIDEAISACEVILMDPYATGTLPRYIRVRIREYYQDVIWRGNPSLVVGDFCTVLHFRDGNRYEVIGASGAGGIDLATPYISIWVYDVSLGLIIPYDTINNALGYVALAAGDFILIPPGTFNESVTLVNGVFICEQIPGTVTLHWTAASGVATTGTVIVADGGYINVRNIYRTAPVAVTDYNAVYVPAAFAGACTIIAENIRSDGPGNGTYGIRCVAGGGTLHVHAKTLTAITATGVTAAAYHETGAAAVINLYIERAYASGATNGYGIWLNGSTVTVYGGEWEGIGGTAGYGWVVVASGTLTGLHARAIGSRNDLYNTGGTLQIFQVQYNSVRLAGGGTIDHLPGDHIVLDLDADTYISALAADDRIDLFVAGANPTDFKFGPSNVITILDNIAQAWSIVDAGGLEYVRIVSTDANPYLLIDPAAAGIKVGIGCTPAHLFEIDGDGTTANLSLYVHRNLAAASTDSPLVYIRQINAGDDQVALQIDQAGTGAALLVNTGRVGIGAAPGAALDVRSTYSHFGDLGGNTYIGGNAINFRNDLNANGDGWINYSGYNHGATQFRDLYIGDGKNNPIATFIGSTGSVGIGCVPQRLLHVAGRLRVDDSIVGPGTTPGVPAPTCYYGTVGACFLSTPNDWLRIDVGGTTYKIPCYL